MAKIRWNYEAITKGLRSIAEGIGVRNYTLTRTITTLDNLSVTLKVF